MAFFSLAILSILAVYTLGYKDKCASISCRIKTELLGPLIIDMIEL